MESFESSFIRGQIAMMENERRRIALFSYARHGLLALYERPFQHVRSRAEFYKEHDVNEKFLMQYFSALESLDSAIQWAHRQV